MAIEEPECRPGANNGLKARGGCVVEAQHNVVRVNLCPKPVTQEHARRTNDCASAKALCARWKLKCGKSMHAIGF